MYVFSSSRCAMSPSTRMVPPRCMMLPSRTSRSPSRISSLLNWLVKFVAVKLVNHPALALKPPVRATSPSISTSGYMRSVPSKLTIPTGSPNTLTRLSLAVIDDVTCVVVIPLGTNSSTPVFSLSTASKPMSGSGISVSVVVISAFLPLNVVTPTTSRSWLSTRSSIVAVLVCKLVHLFSLVPNAKFSYGMKSPLTRDTTCSVSVLSLPMMVSPLNVAERSTAKLLCISTSCTNVLAPSTNNVSCICVSLSLVVLPTSRSPPCMAMLAAPNRFKSPSMKSPFFCKNVCEL